MFVCRGNFQLPWKEIKIQKALTSGDNQKLQNMLDQ